MHEKKKPTAARPPQSSDAARALREVEPELKALQPEQLVQVNIDVPTAASLALGVKPHLVELRPQVQIQLPKHPIHHLDHLDRYAMAAWFAHLQTLPEANPDAAKVLLAEAVPLREGLLVGAEALAQRNLLDGTRVAEIRSGSGNVDIANDLVALAALFQAAWPGVHQKTAVEEQEVSRAAELGPQLLIALGAREVPGHAPAGNAQDLRQRAFTLLVQAYDSCRKAVGYLRWEHGDADTWTPSLFAHKGAGRPASKGDPQPAPAGSAGPGNVATT